MRKTLKLVGWHEEQAEKVARAQTLLYYVGGLVAAIGVDRKDDGLKFAGGTILMSGVVCTHITIGHRQSAARLLREL